VTKSAALLFARLFAGLIAVIVCLGLLLSFVPLSAAAQSPGVTGPKIWLQANQPLPVQHVPASAGQGMMADLQGLGQGQPVSIAAGDLDHDGFQDLVVGYSAGAGGYIAVHRGNIDAFAPQSDESFKAIGRGEFPSPFLLEAPTFSVPVSPDFIVLGNFLGSSNQDLAIAGKGGNTLYVFPGDGKGNFGAPQAFALPGGVNTLAAGRFGNIHQATLVVGLSGPGKNFSLALYAGSARGFSSLGAVSFSGPASNILFGDFGDSGIDIAFLSSGKVQIVRPNLQLTTVSLPRSVSAFALGSFVYDRSGGLQIAALTENGSIQVVARSDFDPRVYTVSEFQAIRRAKINHLPPPAFVPLRSFPTGWQTVESLPGVGSIGAGQTPVLLQTRISINGADDIMWLNAGNGQMAVISHADGQPGAQTFLPGQVSIKPYTGTPLAALSLRTNIDSRPGVIALHQGQISPSLSMPIPDPTFTVNRTDDPTPVSPITNACNGVANDCSLREAILKSNGDTVMVPAGTYTLTIAKVANDCTGNFGALSVENTTTIVGAGQNTTIIQAGTTAYNAGTANGVDMVMNVNEDLATGSCPVTAASASLSNLTLQNGHNLGTQGFDGDGGCMEFDTGSAGTATLSLTNVTLQNCNTLQGGGGGLVIFNSVAPGAGGVTISNSTIQGNSVVAVGQAGNGGGIAIAQDGHMTMTASQVTNNKATQNDGSGVGSGGGILAFFPQNVSAATGETFIHASTISGNKAASFGGGINTSASISIDQGTVVSGNAAGTDGTNTIANQEGGGLYLNPVLSCPSSSTCTATLSNVTITGNTATGNGGGVSYGNASAGTTGALTMSFSRLAGNTTSGGSGSNLNNNQGTATVTDNWWGTNTTPSVAGTINSISATTTFDPWIALTNAPPPPGIVNVNSSIQLTADFLHDNHGNPILLADIDVLLGLPITFNNAILGSLSNAQTSIQLSGTATATFTAGPTGLPGPQPQAHADAVVDNGTATANIIIPLPPVLAKVFGAASIPLNGSTSLSFTVQNNNTGSSLSSTAFSDTLPAGLVISTPNGLTGSCGGGTITATQNTTGISLSGATLAASTGCTFSINVTGISAGLQSNTTGQVSATESGTGGTASANVKVEAPPSIAKVFNPNTISLNATTSLTFTITNPGANPDPLTGVAFTDTLPTGLTVANASATVCGGTLTTTAPTGIALSGATINTSSQCQFSVTVTGAVTGQYTNTTGAVTSTNGGTGNSASASLTVASPPTITKIFGAVTIPLNGTTSLTFTIQNPNTGVTLTGVAFTDNLPAGLVVASTPNLNNTCGGTATVVAGAGSLSLSGGTLAASASCTVSVNIQGTTAGVKNNSVQVSSTNAGTGNTSNASITVVAPPLIIKAFGAASIPLNGSTSLSFTIQNNNISTLTGVGFSDTLPAGLIISTPNGLTGLCGGGTITATTGTNTISLSGASLAAATSCTFSVNVTGVGGGLQNNTTGNVTSTEGGTGGTASATVKVEAPPSIAKLFTPATIGLNTTTSLTFIITNPATNADPLAGVAFTDTLPTGLTVANASATVCGGTLTTTTPVSIALSGATIAANSQCQFSVTVTGAASGQYTNTTGSVTSTNGGTGNTATANLTVASAPSITKAFGALQIPLNGTTSLTFNINNPNTNVSLSGVAFIDNLPAGMVLASTPNVNNTCGGTATAVAGAGSLSLSGGTLAASASCTVSVNIQGTTAGVKNNSVQVSSTNAGTGNTSNASITVVAPPLIIKAFGAASIPLNGSTSLSFTIQNNNAAVSLSGIAFSDTLPAGLVISTPNGLTGSCGGGTITAAQNTSVTSLSGATLAASTSCTFSVSVTGIAAGQKNNTTGQVTSTEGGTGGTASATLNVEAPPAIAKAFNPSAIAPNSSTSLNFTITNPAANAAPLTGVAFTDTLPAGLIVTSSSASVCGGTLTTTGPSGISLSGASVAVNGQCQFSVIVASSTAGTFTNTTGNVTSTNGGTGNSASAVLSVLPANLTITKTHTGTFNRGQTGAVYTITVGNSAIAGPTDGTTITVVDTLPAVQHTLVPTALTGAGWTCTVSTLTCTRTDVLAAGASYPAITLTVNVPQNIVNHFINIATVSGGGDPNMHQAQDPVMLGPPVIISSTDSGSDTVTPGGAATFHFQVDASGVTTLPAVISFTCAGLPKGTACIFNQIINGIPVPLYAAGYSLTQPISQMTMTITTLGPQISSGRRGAPPTYAALLFPVLGLVGIAFAGGKKRKLMGSRLALMLIGLLLLAALAGCGGSPLMTQPGQSTITVTGTVDATNGAVSGSTTVSLTVQ
jgi:uncharacterized repeat protein (TIGR01451 family)